MKKFLCIFYLLSGFLVETRSQSDTLYADSYEQMVDSMFEYFDHSVIPDGFHYDRSFKGSKVSVCTGNQNDSAVWGLEWLFMYYELYYSSLNRDQSPDFTEIEEMSRSYYEDYGVIPIGVIDIKYQELDSGSFTNGSVYNINGQFRFNSINDVNVNTKRVFSVCPLPSVTKEKELAFRIVDDLCIENAFHVQDKIEIDFDDGYGFREIQREMDISVYYKGNGIKNIITRFINSLDTLESKSYIHIGLNTSIETESELRSSISPCEFPELPGDIFFQGRDPDESFQVVADMDYTGSTDMPTGQYGIWYACDNYSRKLRKPIIQIVGFNPGQAKTLYSTQLHYSPIAYYPKPFPLTGVYPVYAPSGFDYLSMRGPIYEHENGQVSLFSERNGLTSGEDNGADLLDRLRIEGYDVIVLFYDKGVDYIQNAAYILTKLIQTVNAELTVNGSDHELVVQGYSYGAMSSRYALNYMENQFELTGDPVWHHRCKTWISFEGEHQGANVPLSVQFFNHTLVTRHIPTSITEFAVKGIALMSLNIMNSTGSRQLSYYHHQFSTNGSPNPDPLFNQLRVEYNALRPNSSAKGYPDYPRRISVSNGTMFGTKVTGIIPNSEAIKLIKYNHIDQMFGTWHLTRYKSRWLKSNGAQTRVFSGFQHGQFNYFPWVIWRNVDIAGHLDVDDAPGSLNAMHLSSVESSPAKLYNCWFVPEFLLAHFSWEAGLHSFSPTVSTLDVRLNGQPAPLLTNLDDLGLNYVRLNELGIIEKNSELDYGFPHLSYPSDHYNITPFDGVYAVGIPEDDREVNQEHVADPQRGIANYLCDVEIAPANLFLKNRTIGDQYPYSNQFEARSSISAGRKPGFHDVDGDWIIGPMGKQTLHAHDSVILEPGFDALPGCSFEAKVHKPHCDPADFTRSLEISNLENETHPTYDFDEYEYQRPFPLVKGQKEIQVDVFPNPSSGRITIITSYGTGDFTIFDARGVSVAEGTFIQNQPVEFHIENQGVYLLRISTLGLIEYKKILIYE